MCINNVPNISDKYLLATIGASLLNYLIQTLSVLLVITCIPNIIVLSQAIKMHSAENHLCDDLLIERVSYDFFERMSLHVFYHDINVITSNRQ